MSFSREPGQAEQEEQARQAEVRWFYASLLGLGSLFVLLFYIASGVHWWNALLLDTEQYPFRWARFGARLLTVPAPAVIGAFYLSDVRRSWWALFIVAGAITVFVLLLFLGMGIKFWAPGT